jgi:general secretion pathway protein G
MRLRKKDGFTLIEVIVVAGIIAILAGILVPLIFKEIDEARTTRTQADMRSISSAIFIMRKDTGKWPTYDGACAVNAATMLAGAGNMPAGAAAAGFDPTTTIAFDEPLSLHASGCYANWKGPYVAIVAADPWGNSYISNVSNLAAAGLPVWILSAGPNGTVDTNPNAAVVAGDDIGVRLR